jgi:peptidoglycan/LPS O-acetylase OafA/YrhL
MERNTNTLYPLRFLAAVMVVFYHYTPPAIVPQIALFIKNGGEAVNFFFFLSGFVMVIANGKYLKSTAAAFPKTDFYLKRLARIYPLYLFAILTLAFFHYGIKSIDTASVKYRLPFEILGVQRWLYSGSFNYPGWTISCEFFFYLLFPIAIVYMRKNIAKYKLFVVGYFVLSVIATCILYYIAERHIPGAVGKISSTLYLHPVFQLSTFLLGTICGTVYLDNRLPFFQKTGNSRLAVLVCAVIIVFVKYLLPENFPLIRAGILAPVYFVFVLGITSFTQQQTKLFSSSFSLFLGEISYGVYIMQYPVYVFYSHFISEPQSWPALIGFVIVLIIVTSITYYLLEKPAKKAILSWYHKKTAAAKVNYTI